MHSSRPRTRIRRTAMPVLVPEGLTFIPASTSPTGAPMLAVANEVSGTTTLSAIEATARG